MPLSGKLVADFDDFYEAVQRAEVELRGFETEAHKVEKSLERMADSFSGRKVQSEAEIMAKAIERIGGASKLTAQEQERANRVIGEALDKYRALGEDAPEHLTSLHGSLKTSGGLLDDVRTKTAALGSAFGNFIGNIATDALYSAGRAIVGVASSALELGEQMTNLHKATGISVDELQRMHSVAAQTDTSLDSIAKAAQKLSVNISGGSDSVKAALDELGIAWGNIKAEPIEQQMRMASTALQGITNETDRARIGGELYGSKLYNEIAPAIASGYSSMADAVTVATDQQIAALNRAKETVDAFQRDASNAITLFVADWIEGFNAVNSLNWADWARVVFMGREDIADHAAMVKASMGDIALSVTTTGESIKSYGEQLAAAKTEVAALTTEQREEIKAAQELGISADAITEKLGISAQAQKLLGQSTKETTEALRLQAKLLGTDTVAEADKLMAALDTLAAKGLRPVKAEVDGIVAALQKAQAALMETGQTTEESYRQFDRLQKQINALTGLTSEGLLPSTPLGTGGNALGFAPAVGPSTGAAVQEAHSLIAVERYLEDINRQWEELEAASAKATESATAGVEGLNQALQQTQHGMQGAVIEWTRWADTATTDLLRLHDQLRQSSINIAGPVSAGINWMQQSQIREEIARRGQQGWVVNVNASNSFYDSPESVQRLADKVGIAMTSRTGR